VTRVLEREIKTDTINEYLRSLRDQGLVSRVRRWTRQGEGMGMDPTRQRVTTNPSRAGRRPGPAAHLYRRGSRGWVSRGRAGGQGVAGGLTGLRGCVARWMPTNGRDPDAVPVIGRWASQLEGRPQMRFLRKFLRADLSESGPRELLAC
jgi:hypothetical protein